MGDDRAVEQLFTLTPEELTAIKLSLKVAALATLASLPIGVAVALVLTRGRFLGRPLLNALVLLPLVLPPVVTGYVLLLLFGRQRADRARPRRGLRHRARLPLDRRGARLRHHGLPAHGARDPIVAGGGRPQAGAGRLDARGQRGAGVLHGDAAAGAAGHHRRRHPVIRARHGRIRRHHHLRLQHPRRDADAAEPDLHLHASSRRRCRRAQADLDLGRDLARRHPRLGGVRQARAEAKPRRRPRA